jgi:hypothetical protein
MYEYERVNKFSSMMLPINTNPDGHIKKHRQMALGQICLFYEMMRGEENIQISVDLKLKHGPVLLSCRLF